jgi:hypothetical protein
VTTTAVTVDKLLAAIHNAKNGDTIECVGGGMALIDGGVQPYGAQNLTIHAYGATLRHVLHAIAYDEDEKRIAAIDALGIPVQSYSQLNAQDKTHVDQYLKQNPGLDYSGVKDAAKMFLATLPPITELWRNTNPARVGEIGYHGKSYLLPIEWTAGNGDILAPKVGVWNTSIYGIMLENAKTFYNSAAVHGTGGGMWLQDATIIDGDNGRRGNAKGLVPSPTGDWFYEYPPTRFVPYGALIGKNNTYDGCGYGGISHGDYIGHVLYAIEFGSTAIHMNGGNAFKFVNGVMAAINCTAIDKGNTFDGVLEPGDTDAGAAYFLNNNFEKWTAGTGNYGSVIQHRNGRTPIASWFENAVVARGNRLTYGLNHQAWFIRANEEPAFVYGWPGKPTPIRTLIRDNVFICPPGYPVGKTPILSGTGGSDVGNNVLITTNDPVPDTRISLPNYDFTPSTWRQWMSDAISAQDPKSAAWLAKLTAMPLYPPGAP